ncbi:MAG: hypothetical protein K8R44_06955, partial [Sulfurimonas sp.]|nr:hypothetical protein [Sulfurimonas sp.]
MKAKGVIDSLNFSSSNLEELFCSEDYIIETVKSIGIFEPDVWLKTFKHSLMRNIVEAKILHISNGLTVPIKRFSASQNKQTLEFAGLHGYNDKSILLSELLRELMPSIQNEVITRIDVAIDFKGKIPYKVIKKLCETRVPFSWHNSSYLKTESEKKTNTHINIILYPKHIKENLAYELERLEFSFRGSYFKGPYLVKDIQKVYLK